MTKNERLATHTDAIQAAEGELALAKIRLVEVCVYAHLDGLSWQDIGDALGISRAAAWQRFSPHSPKGNS